MDFTTIDYLETGSSKQQKIFRLLTKHRIFQKLASYAPILCGTIPINIDVESSDLDIICSWKNKEKFIADLKFLFEKESNFKLKETIRENEESVIANFFIENVEFEIFGQNVPTESQRAYLHMLTEYRILQERGEVFREKIIALKRQGIKTEPAFAQILGLKGDPYEELLKL